MLSFIVLKEFGGSSVENIIVFLPVAGAVSPDKICNFTILCVTYFIKGFQTFPRSPLPDQLNLLNSYLFNSPNTETPYSPIKKYKAPWVSKKYFTKPCVLSESQLLS